jgi:hypothetical protein
MAAEQQPLDITNLPELAHLVDEVRRTRRPRLLRRANVDLAVLSPLPDQARPRPLMARKRQAAALAVVARTAGALRSDLPFPGIDAERAAAEEAMAADAVSRDG